MHPVLVDSSGAVLTITLNRPEHLNAVTTDLLHALSDACVQARGNDVRAVILTGSGRGFCAGGDIKAPKIDMEPGSRRLRQLYHPALLELATLPKPVIAAVNGVAAGAGVSLAAAADIRIASDHARFLSGFVDVGLAPDTGASYLLRRLMGYSAAFAFLTTGQPVAAPEALRLGLVNEVVEHENLLTRAHELASLLAGKPGIGVSATKSLLLRADRNSLVEQLEAEAQTYDLTSSNEERLAARAKVVERISRTT
jgi:2-(1,2-epoxy-1,2-dihydrophenyl)acetyl-CoA isomerase